MKTHRENTHYLKLTLFRCWWPWSIFIVQINSEQKIIFLGWSKHIVFFVEGRKRSSDKTEPAAKCDKAERKMSGC